MQRQEKLLTKEEIQSIEKEAENPIYRESKILHLGMNYFSILRVSIEKGIILIRGNEDTGLEHINLRHNEYQKRPFWKMELDKAGNEQIKLDNPSKFSNLSIPIFTYTEIADKVFSEENKKIEENKNPDLFDVYSSEFTHRDGSVMKYRLVTYKDSKIIHTLIPLKKTYTRDKILDLYRGAPHGEQSLMTGNIKIEIPYLNHENEIICKLIFLIDGQTLKEEVFIEYFKRKNASISYKIAERHIIGKIDVPRYLTYLQFNDLREFEKSLKALLKMIEEP